MREFVDSITKWSGANGKQLRFIFWIVAGFIVAIAFSHVVPFLPHTLAVYLLIAAFWKLREEWYPDSAPRNVAGRASFPVICAAVMTLIALWFGNSVMSEIPFARTQDFPILIAAFSLAATVSILRSLWLARLYWDAKIRLAMLEQIVRETTGIDPDARRRAFFADPARRATHQTPLMRRIAPQDLAPATGEAVADEEREFDQLRAAQPQDRS